MADSLDRAIAQVREVLLDDASLVRAIASGKRRSGVPAWRRVELRYVDLKAGRRLQVTRYDQTQAHVANLDPTTDGAALDELLAEPYGNWRLETSGQVIQIRVTKKGDALVHTKDRVDPVEADTSHDRSKDRLLPADHPVLAALGIADAAGRIKPSRQAKYRQVEEFLRALGPAISEAIDAGALRRPTSDAPLLVVDLGCGNAYLTFAAHAYLSSVLGLPVTVVGVDSKKQALEHNSALAEQLAVSGEVSFVRSDIAGYRPETTPDVVLALHACDTATDDALARGIEWGASLILAAPCCHHDVSAQLRQAPAPFASLTRDGILRERFADTLTDALRASALRALGYRVHVVEFVESKHTPRNTLLKAVRVTDSPTETTRRSREELDELEATWQVRPKLVELLGDRLG